MRILVLGGTVFLGRHFVAAALARGHEITMFTRGLHNPDLFPEVERLRGDRTEDLSILSGRTWDAVVDTSGYFPRIVRMSAGALRDSVGRYLFVSTLSVYADNSTPNLDESAALATIDDPGIEEITGETYGALKVLCERVVEEVYGGRATIVRPGLIVGPDDPSDRFTYWPHRVAWGGEVLAPGDPDAGVQIIDVRDLAAWMVDLLETDTGGAFNATSPAGLFRFTDVLEACRDASGSGATVTWVPEDFLLEHDVEPWTGLPLWIPDVPEMAGFNSISVRSALERGLEIRTLAETVRDTLLWDRTRPEDEERKAGISREREQELLAAWHTRAGTQT